MHRALGHLSVLVMEDGIHKAAAVHLAAVLPREGLTTGERTLLVELLDRLAQRDGS